MVGQAGPGATLWVGGECTDLSFLCTKCSESVTQGRECLNARILHSLEQTQIYIVYVQYIINK